MQHQGENHISYVKFEKLNLKTHPEFNERWVQDRIAEDPSILGLGDVILKDKERIQPRAGRLDLLLQEADGNRRFEVEVQLGATDESHIIRTIEYWDIERKRYPQYDHTAVIIAEDAIQMNALKTGDQVGLVFTTVLNQVSLGLVEEDEEVSETTDRGFWEKRATKQTVALADELLKLLRPLDPSLELKFNKFYIGLARGGQPDNFVIFRPKKDWIRIEPRLKRSEATQERLESSGLDVMDYDERWGRYRIRIASGDISKHQILLSELFKESYEAANL